MKDAITKDNIGEYLFFKYGVIPVKTYEDVLPVTPLRQGDYGGENDCTLTSITSVINYLTEQRFNVSTIYKIVETIAKKYFYRPSGMFSGTFLLFISSIMKKSYDRLNLKYKKIHGAYIKGIGFSFNKIVNILLKGTPVIINLSRANDGYYHSHTVTIVGFALYNNKYRFLVIEDNWEPEYRYIDYDEMNSLCSINWSE